MPGGETSPLQDVVEIRCPALSCVPGPGRCEHSDVRGEFECDLTVRRSALMKLRAQRAFRQALAAALPD